MANTKSTPGGSKVPKAMQTRENGIASSTKEEQKAPSNSVKLVFAAAATLLLAAAYSPISQLTLSPVYGSVPSAAFHRRGMMVAALCGWIGKEPVNKMLSARAMYLLPVLAFFIPTIQYFMFQQSTRLGPLVGPCLTETLSYFPLVLLSVSAAATMLERAGLSRGGQSIMDHASFLGSYLFFSTSQKAVAFWLPMQIGTSIIFTRPGLQFLVALLYALIFPSNLLLLAIPSLLFSAGLNVHVPLDRTTALLNSTLHSEDYILLHRQESLTGYLSVVENTKNHFRALRCDHSILGGEWTHVTNQQHPELKEPIYAIFTMLEAARLIKPEKGDVRKADTDSNALVIGLGIGTTPGAFVTHGIDTTVVEIDPAVHQLASTYFSLPNNFTPVIQDAVEFVETTRVTGGLRYDYIVHDVFTGGVEPVSLFTLEFMEGLRALLREDGVIAINYAGDLTLPSAGLVVRTILSVFPTCRIFREGEPPADRDKGDFTNMVVFCKLAESPLEFRKATKADFLGSRSRQAYLMPKFEIDPAVFKLHGNGKQEILANGDVGELRAWQSHSAVGHWKIMRTVLPASLWEKW